jgi:hypothetical protein
MRRRFIVFVVLFFPLASFCQTVIINGTVGKRDLSWNDFPGIPDPESKFVAYTYWNLNYRYQGASFKGDTAFFEGLKSELRLNAGKTWLRKGRESDRLLKHEQGHFDIGHLAMLEFMKRANETAFFRSDFRQKIQALFREVLEKYRDMGSTYDEETQHFNNQKKQREWDAFLQSELAKDSQTQQ